MNQDKTFVELEHQFGSESLTFALERLDAAALAFRADDSATVGELHEAAWWYRLMSQAADLLTGLSEFEDARLHASVPVPLRSSRKPSR